MRGEDLTGQKFGKLTVLEATEDTQQRYRVWRCHCECGKEVLVNTKRLRRGTVASCGCGSEHRPRGRTSTDLSGRRFGMLVVLERAGSINGRVAWRCRCDCGNERVVPRDQLISGTATHCGCLFEVTRKLEGRRIGRLTVLYATNRRSYKGSVIWRCRCDCGGEAEYSQDALIYGRTTSCGCRKRELEEQFNAKDYLTFVDGTCVEWLENRRRRSDASALHTGVYPTARGTYRAMIGFQGKRYYLGTYKAVEEAVEARLEAEEVLHRGFLKAYYAWQAAAERDPAWAKENPFQFEVRRTDHGFEVEGTVPDSEGQ